MSDELKQTKPTLPEIIEAWNLCSLELEAIALFLMNAGKMQLSDGASLVDAQKFIAQVLEVAKELANEMVLKETNDRIEAEKPMRDKLNAQKTGGEVIARGPVQMKSTNNDPAPIAKLPTPKKPQTKKAGKGATKGKPNVRKKSKK